MGSRRTAPDRGPRHPGQECSGPVASPFAGSRMRASALGSKPRLSGSKPPAAIASSSTGSRSQRNHGPTRPSRRRRCRRGGRPGPARRRGPRRAVVLSGDRDLLEAELLGRLEAGVAGDDDALGVDDDRLPEPEAADALGDGVHGVVVEAWVARVGADGIDGLGLDLHVAAPPTRYRHGARPGARKSGQGGGLRAPRRTKESRSRAAPHRVGISCHFGTVVPTRCKYWRGIVSERAV